MRKTRFLYFSILCIGLTFSNCSKEMSDILDSNPESQSVSINLKGSLKEGKKLPNPYSIPHMEEAKQVLLSEGQIDEKLLEGIQIKPTDLYVRFKIKKAGDYEILAKEMNLELFPYPLDYDFGDEPGVIEYNQFGDKPEWLYTVVEKDFNFPDIPYKIIEEVFMPKTYIKQFSDDQSLKSILRVLEQKSYELCGLGSSSQQKAMNVYPTGNISVENTVTSQLEPVVGIKVRGRKLLNYGYAFTDSNGDYTLDEDFTGDINYCMILENTEGFKIWSDMAFLSPGIYEFGKHSSAGWDLPLWEGLQGWRWATVNNATYDFYQYCDSAGIASPPSDMRIWYWDGDGRKGSAGMFRHLFGAGWVNYASTVSDYLVGFGVSSTVITSLMTLVGPDLTITCNPSTISSEGLYSLVSHECSHASHYSHGGNSVWYQLVEEEAYYGASGSPYGDGEQAKAELIMLCEGWGYYHEHQRTLNKYGVSYILNNFAAFENFDPVLPGDPNDYFRPNYSYIYGWIPGGLFWDLIDSNVDNVRSTYYDNVSGYTITQIHNAMDSDVDDMQEFKARLLSENNWHDYNDLLSLFQSYRYY